MKFIVKTVTAVYFHLVCYIQILNPMYDVTVMK